MPLQQFALQFAAILTIVPKWEHYANMDWQNDEDRLILDISMGLKKRRYAPPRKTHDCAERDRYYLSVASEVVRQLKLSWSFTPKRNAARL